MAKHFKEEALVEYLDSDPADLEFIVRHESGVDLEGFVDDSATTVTLFVRDSRKKEKVLALSIGTEIEKKALIEGLRFFSDILKEKTFGFEWI